MYKKAIEMLPIAVILFVLLSSCQTTYSVHGFEAPIAIKSQKQQRNTPKTVLNVLYAPIKLSTTRSKSTWYCEYNPTARIVKYDDEYVSYILYG
jgi:hypothetical protein